MEGRWSATGRTRRHRWARGVLPVLFVSALATVTLGNSGYAVGARLSIDKSPVSDGVKMALARNHLAGPSRSPTRGAVPTVPGLTVLPNVQASTGMSNEVPITADPVTTSHLLTGSNGYTCTGLQEFDNSDDSGATWRHHCLPVVHDSGCGDPAVGYDRTGKAYIFGIDCGFSTGNIIQQTSTDNGVTWSPAKVAFNSLLGGLTDKEWAEVDQSATSPFVNCVYVSWTDFDTSFTKTRASVAHSCNGGTTWTPIAVDSTQTVPKIDQFTDLAIGPDGTVYLTWQYCKTNGPAADCGDTDVDLKLSKSTDGGNTWTPAVVIGTAHNSPDTCGGYYGCFPGSSERLSNIPVIDINDSTGTLNVAYYTYTGGSARVKVIRSTDGGTTWSAPIEPITKLGNQGWPWLSQNGSNVGVSFDHSGQNGSFIYVAAFSTDDGVSYTQKAKLSTAKSKFSNDGNGGTFIGDYTGNIWTGNTLHASWTDARTSPGVDMTGGATI